MKILTVVRIYQSDDAPHYFRINKNASSHGYTLAYRFWETLRRHLEVR